MADVLVVGAGPVGLAMAAELARHGCRCRITARRCPTVPPSTPISGASLSAPVADQAWRCDVPRR